MRTTAEDRARLRDNCISCNWAADPGDMLKLLDDIDELLAERRTLRDEMAMAALTGLVTRVHSEAEGSANIAYANADAMLAARSLPVEGKA